MWRRGPELSVIHKSSADLVHTCPHGFFGKSSVEQKGSQSERCPERVQSLDEITFQVFQASNFPYFRGTGLMI